MFTNEELAKHFKLGKVLDTNRRTQGFGENPNIYKRFGLNGHNGIDYGTPNGSKVYAPCDLKIVKIDGRKLTNGQWDSGYGLHLRCESPLVSINNEQVKLEVTFGHLQSVQVVVGDLVPKGFIIALSNNSGFSTGPHLHVGVRLLDGSGQVVDYNNGFLGYINHGSLIENQLSGEYPVDNFYGQKRNWASFLREKWVVWAFTTKVKRLPTHREIKGLAYGYWDLPSILDPAMFITWVNMTKIEYNSKL